MLLTALTEAITTHLNSSPGSWSEAGVVAKSELDPTLCAEPTLGVYVVPVFPSYSIEGSSTRKEVVSLQRILYIGLIVVQTFDDIPDANTKGVANWDEAKVVVDIWQKATEFIIGYKNSDLRLAEIEVQPADELELEKRNFAALTTFGWENFGCDTQHVSNSLSTALKEGTPLEKTRASMRQQLLSGRKPGRR